jgi:hypothetical protein
MLSSALILVWVIAIVSTGTMQKVLVVTTILLIVALAVRQMKNGIRRHVR